MCCSACMGYVVLYSIITLRGLPTDFFLYNWGHISVVGCSDQGTFANPNLENLTHAGMILYIWLVVSEVFLYQPLFFVHTKCVENKQIVYGLIRTCNSAFIT